ncbi:MAG: glutamate--tRNA ligase [Candidatus Dadabacteria bacterium]|nr:glutamate--tRNA ligase [Candidatus Dadabacteria bacterium]
MTVKTRFAPSPTGALHIGGVRTAIFNWLFARHHKGSFVLRIEDTDRARSTKESLLEILESMQWLGLNWDGEPVKQSERLNLYKGFAERLLDEGKAYKCYVSAEELTAKREEAKARGEVFRYRREWAQQGASEKKPYAIRLQTPDTGTIDVEDAIRGPVLFKAKEIDDFIIMKTDGFPTYNFAVAVDDSDMEITHIIRGDDHLSNTPKQALIYQALGRTPPIFAHVSMIMGPDRTKLSKRHGAISVTAYRDMGYLPEALINYLARLGWSHGDQEIFSTEELIEKFTLDSVGKSAAVFNPDKLLWLNGWYIRNKPARDIAATVLPTIQEKGLPAEFDERFVAIVDMVRERAKTLLDITDSMDYFYKDEITYEEKARKKFLVPENTTLFETLIKRLSALDSFDQETLHGLYNEIAESMELKLGQVAQPTRVALTGGTVSPGIFEVMEMLGKDVVIERLKRARAECT